MARRKHIEKAIEKELPKQEVEEQLKEGTVEQPETNVVEQKVVIEKVEPKEETKDVVVEETVAPKEAVEQPKEESIESKEEYKLYTVFPKAMGRNPYMSVNGVRYDTSFVRNINNLIWANEVQKCIANKDANVFCFGIARISYLDKESYVKGFFDKMIKAKKINFKKKSSYLSVSEERTLLFIENNEDNIAKLKVCVSSVNKHMSQRERRNVVLEKLLECFK